MKSILRFAIYSATPVMLAALMACGGGAPESSQTEEPMEETPRMTDATWTGPKVSGPDARAFVAADEFEKASEGEWLSPEKTAAFPFDELIYSWDVAVPEREGFRLYLQVGFDDNSASPWLYAGYWGDVELVESRENPSFDHGYIAMDQLLLKKKATTFQYKVVDKGSTPLSVLPALYVVTTDNEKVDKDSTPKRDVVSEPFVLDLPYRAQADSLGNPMPDRCQSAALATALQYFGDDVPTEKIVAMAWDPEYEYPGIWPRTIGAATQLGYDGYIDRFRDWDHVAETLAENKVILVSMSMPKDGDYKAPPYASMGGHIIALNGITPDGRVVVTDSALKPGPGSQCQWLKEDFEKVWMTTKGGVGMVICPPEDAAVRKVASLAEFPGDRREE